VLLVGTIVLVVAAAVAASPLRPRSAVAPRPDPGSEAAAQATPITTPPVPVEDPLFTDEDLAPPRALGRAPRVAVFADSLGVEARPHLESLAVERGWQLRFDGHGGTATCDYLDRMRRAADEFAPDVVVIQFSGNALTPCITSRAGGDRAIVGPSGTELDLAAYGAAYLTDTVAAIEAFGPDVDVVLVGVPVTRGGSSPAALLVDELYRALAAAHPHVHHLSLDRLLTPGHAYAEELPCLLVEPCAPGTLVPVRHPDGGHLCAAPPSFCFGGLRFAASIDDGVGRLVTAVAPAA
jgi:hypothetical protein